MRELTSMTTRTKRLLALLFLVTGTVITLIACGGGESAPDGRKQALGVGGTGNAIAWTPGAIAFSVNPGGKQDIPVTFTSTAALSNVTVTVVPELKNIVSVSPASFATLAAGQQATVTLTVRPNASESLRLVEGTIRLVSGTSTVAKPLPVKLTLVAPQLINGIAVPPEPPPELNNATLAGFDTNGNGVRDDVERLIAVRYSTSAHRFSLTTSVARNIQSALTVPSTENLQTYINGIRCIFDNDLLADVITVERAMLSNGLRSQAYGNLTAGAFVDEEGC